MNKQYTIEIDRHYKQVTMEHKVIYDELFATLSEILLPSNFDYNSASYEELTKWRDARSSAQFITESTTKKILDRLAMERKEQNNG